MSANIRNPRLLRLSELKARDGGQAQSGPSHKL